MVQVNSVVKENKLSLGDIDGIAVIERSGVLYGDKDRRIFCKGSFSDTWDTVRSGAYP